jgi:hypothetical protein
VPWRTAWDTYPGIDIATMVQRLVHIRGSALRRLLLDDDAEWGPDEENRARQLEVEAYRLELDWVEHTTDPNDPATIRERNEAKRRGDRPPRRPIIPPVALRPAAVADRRWQAYLDELLQLDPKPTKELVTLDEFDRVIARM